MGAAEASAEMVGASVPPSSSVVSFVVGAAVPVSTAAVEVVSDTGLSVTARFFLTIGSRAWSLVGMAGTVSTVASTARVTG